MQVKRIAVVGLYSIRNMGDRIICDTTKYLINKERPEIELIELDAVPRKKLFYKGIHFIKYIIAVGMLRVIGPKLFKRENSSRFRYYFELCAWKLRLGFHYKRVLNSVDAVIFSGGGFLKFRTQGLNYYVEQIIHMAARKNLPVMISGVGIEDYDDKDIRCQKLKAAINMDCVKIITTRDDIAILENNYIFNKNIITALVGDPALWVPECYKCFKVASSTIGINIIRGNVFRDYGNEFTYNDVKIFYKNLLTECQKRGLNWVLFSNGMEGDQKIGREILKALHLPVKGNLLPAPKSAVRLVQMISEFEYIMAARLHACITAYSMDIPVIGLIWNDKTLMFSTQIDKSENFFSETELNICDIVDAMEQCINYPYNSQIRDDLKQSTKKYISDFLTILLDGGENDG